MQLLCYTLYSHWLLYCPSGQLLQHTLTQIPEKCSHVGCMPMVISWEGFKDIQTGDVLIVEIDDSLLVLDDNHTNKDEQ